jgi:hypothetical protein
LSALGEHLYHPVARCSSLIVALPRLQLRPNNQVIHGKNREKNGRESRKY